MFTDSNDIGRAWDVLKKAAANDPEWAWAVHCNLAMPIMDSTDLSHAAANMAGARLMQHLFDYDITKHPYFVDMFAPQEKTNG